MGGQQQASDADTTRPLKVLTDEPKFSSAALSITFLLCIADIKKTIITSFRPEFTHQCVGEQELFAGYRPPKSVVEAARLEIRQGGGGGEQQQENDDTEAILHKSHQWHHHHHHQNAIAELAVDISLAPSCESCHIQIHIQPQDEPSAKRIKLDTEDSSMKTLSEGEILDSLRIALPPIEEGPTAANDVKEKFLSQPVGQMLEEYTVVQGNNQDSQSVDFVITLADGRDPKVAQYHHKIQPLALFYIENADNVDVGATDNGYWKVLYVFQKHRTASKDAFSLVGYFTLFHFIALFHKPQPGIIVRICQALILPPFQGQGHGTRMFQAVYKLAHNQYPEVSNPSNQIDYGAVSQHVIVQVNVEDPAPAFVALRNKTDFAFVQQYSNKFGWPNWNQENTSNLNVNFFMSLTEAQAMDLSAKVKITVPQIHIVNDLIKLQALQDSLYEEREQELDRYFRLMVKKRLNKENREELGGLGSKEQQKARLAELFEERLMGYNGILKSKRNTTVLAK
ncbi:histone acetyltransferase [Nitzschia inconspicua]|uniref:Histone acetyltransferase n=1 Tax=Nitzschia inconspicua TaxID=303405 RepID=A0A9K3M4N6_9STRA|nr:histone acetyltransferase [Nitzschia inconspicua]